MGSLRDLLNAQRETKPAEVSAPVVPENKPAGQNGVSTNSVKQPTGLAARLAAAKAGRNATQRNVERTQSAIAPIAAPTAQSVSMQNDSSTTSEVSGAIQRTQVAATAKIDNKIGDDVLAQIQGHIRYLAENINEKELVGQTVRTIAMQLQQNPQVHALITNPEYDIITRGFMSAYNFAARKRAEKQEKRTAKKETSIANREDLDKAFDAIDFSL